jgi:2-oxoisovalerate dehydrogenase E2 component (dihydrolipoyl transacylase)
VAQFENVVEVQSDKAKVDITSRYDGVVTKLYYAVGQMAKTNSPLMDIEVSDGGAADGASAPVSSPALSSPVAAAVAAEEEEDTTPAGLRGLATPAVRRIAKEYGVDIARIRGSGKDGRVLKEDVQKFVDGKGSERPAAAAQAQAQPQRGVEKAEARVVDQSPAKSTYVAAPLGSRAPPADTKVAIRGITRAMAKSMSAAWVRACHAVSIHQVGNTMSEIVSRTLFSFDKHRLT